MDAERTWVAVGATVIDGADRLRKIAKVYKNGNFVLEGDAQQYRALHDKTAVAAGDWRFGNRPHVVPATPEALAARAERIALARAKAVISAEIDRLTILRRTGHDGEILAEADRLRAISDKIEARHD